ncbi:MAG: ATP-binding protein, partial [Nitrospirota bacterium]
AHSIRNPLASIRSSAEVTLGEVASPFFRRTAEDIIAQVDRVEKWVRELLTSSQPLGNTQTPVQINELIRENLRNVEKEIDKQGIKLVIELREPLPLLQADAALLSQMLNSLISNALEAMPNGGTLTVDSKSPEDRSRIEIRIIDTGFGIPEDQIEKMFKPFFTLKQKGLGMGLYLAKRIVERHGGTIDLSSVEGQGTTILLKLPVLL